MLVRKVELDLECIKCGLTKRQPMYGAVMFEVVLNTIAYQRCFSCAGIYVIRHMKCVIVPHPPYITLM